MERRILDGIATVIVEDSNETIIIDQPDEMVIEGECFEVETIEDDGEWGVCVGINGRELPAYIGPFRVVPLIASEQILQTANKSVYQDIEVTKIPVYETTNPSGGLTVFIGGDISYG